MVTKSWLSYTKEYKAIEKAIVDHVSGANDSFRLEFSP